MSDKDYRQLLSEVMQEIDSGRLTVRHPRGGLFRYLGPPLLAASLGLGACGDTAIGTGQDAGPGDDGTVATDAVGYADAAYMAPFDARPWPDARPLDGYVIPPYMGPPFDGGPVPEYMGPTVDAGSEDEDGGITPLYMAPPEPDEDP
jgi:hypothetical protein